MIKTYTIKEFEDIIKIGTTMGKNWYRGHSKIFNDLTPGIFRSQYNSPLHEIFKPQQEFEIVHYFKRYAPTIINKIPEEFDFLTWLFWIQHYGMPTRLLDWSENILVAAFFCVISDENEDGEIWTIYPDKLNEKSGFWGLALTNNAMVKYLSGEPFSSNPDKLLKKCKLSEKPKNPIALVSPNLFPRMSAQFSTFTLHPKPDNINSPINLLLEGEKEIGRYIIPKNLKAEIENKLNYLGFNHRTLFPDFEGLSKNFARNERYFGWGQPNPPKFKELD